MTNIKIIKVKYVLNILLFSNEYVIGWTNMNVNHVIILRQDSQILSDIITQKNI